MSNRKSIQVLRGTADKIENLSPDYLADGQPLYDKTNNYLYIGNNLKNKIEPITCKELCMNNGIDTITPHTKLPIDTETHGIDIKSEDGNVQIDCGAILYGHIDDTNVNLKLNIYRPEDTVYEIRPGWLGYYGLRLKSDFGEVALREDGVYVSSNLYSRDGGVTYEGGWTNIVAASSANLQSAYSGNIITVDSEHIKLAAKDSDKVTDKNTILINSADGGISLTTNVDGGYVNLCNDVCTVGKNLTVINGKSTFSNPVKNINGVESPLVAAKELKYLNSAMVSGTISLGDGNAYYMYLCFNYFSYQPLNSTTITLTDLANNLQQFFTDVKGTTNNSYYYHIPVSGYCLYNGQCYPIPSIQSNYANPGNQPYISFYDPTLNAQRSYNMPDAINKGWLVGSQVSCHSIMLNNDHFVS